jgi:hypothetical protein
VYRRMVRLVVRDHLSTVNGTGKVYDSHFGAPNPAYVSRYNTNIDFNTGNAKVFYKSHSSESGYTIEENAFKAHTQIPTNDLNEWFFICATYNPEVDEEASFLDSFSDYLTDKQWWLNHRNSDGTLSAQGTRANGDLLGARCKVEIISRSDLLRARGYKIDSLEVNVEEETTEQEQQSSGN